MQGFATAHGLFVCWENKTKQVKNEQENKLVLSLMECSK